MNSLCKEVKTRFGCDLRDRVVAVTMDHGRGLNKARAEVFKKSERILDFFHVVEAHNENVHGKTNGVLRDAIDPEEVARSGSLPPENPSIGVNSFTT